MYRLACTEKTKTKSKVALLRLSEGATYKVDSGHFDHRTESNSWALLLT